MEEVLVVGSAVIAEANREEAEKVDWHFWSQDDTISGISDNGEYQKAENFYDRSEGRLGLRLVLSMYLNSMHPRQVAVHQDFVYAYGLVEEGNFLLRPSEGYEQVVRFTRGEDGGIKFVEIRSEYLRDYLAARKSALRLYYYRQRQAILADKPDFDWPEDHAITSEEHNRCEVRCDEIDSSGDFPGASWAVFSAWRTDVDPDEDVPDFSEHNDENTASEKQEGVMQGSGLRYRVSGELWRGEWIEPAATSCRVGYSEPEENLYVTLDGGGEKADLSSLRFEEVGKYLWFKPEVMPALLSHRGAKLTWYTADTGGIDPQAGSALHFGVNRLGLINAYAYDVARRPLWQRRIWVAHNVRPDGGVSSELLDAQMKSKPASTKAAEHTLPLALGWLESVIMKKFNVKLFRDHDEVESLGRAVHRFRAVDEIGLQSLAKDMVKITIERINKGSLIKALSEMKSDLGTLKLLEKLLATYTDETYARKSMAPLFGLYDLRVAYAHLSSSDLESCYERLQIDRSQPLVVQAASMIDNVAITLGTIGGDLNKQVPVS